MFGSGTLSSRRNSEGGGNGEQREEEKEEKGNKKRVRHPTGGQMAEAPLNSIRRMTGSWNGVDESMEDIRRASEAQEARRVGIDLSVNHSGYEAIGEDGVSEAEERQMRKKLAFHFMDPVQKYKARGQTPWKLIMQFLKVAFVTAQLIIFGNYRYNHNKYYADNQIAFEHIFLKGWDAVREIHAYPPATGTYAIYKKQDFYAYFDYIGQTYTKMEDMTVNPVFRSGPFNYCFEKFAEGEVFPNLTWTIDFEHLVPQVNCTEIPFAALASNFSSLSYLKSHGFDVPWDTVKWMQIKFKTETLTYLELGPLYGPECFVFQIEIFFDNQDYDGQIPVKLRVQPHRKECPKPRIISTSKSTTIRLLNYLVIITCFISLVLCCRALIRAQRLRTKAEQFFGKKFEWTLTRSEKLEFLNGWYIVICINDILIIIGSVIKEMIETRNTYGDLWDFCSVFLGCGNLLVWVGMLRYLGFFKDYNILIITLKRALPNCLRFLICASLIYLGFVFCGWVILGPYHFKFKTIMSTSECLFSLINGDDMFATFSSVPDTSGLIWAFSRIYLYVFISLFIYVILSLFIAIIMDVYDAIKEFYKDGWPKNRMREFYEPDQSSFQPGDFGPRRGLRRTVSNIFQRVASSAQLARDRNGNNNEDERSPLIT